MPSKKQPRQEPQTRTEYRITRELGLSIAKLMISGAWADGEIQNEEAELLEQFLARILGFSEQDLWLIDLYMEYPISIEEAHELVMEFNGHVRTEEDKQFAIDLLDRMIKSDNQVTREEKAFYMNLMNAIKESEVGKMGTLSRLFSRKRQDNEDAPPQQRVLNREVHLDDYINNIIYFRYLQDFMDKHPDEKEEELLRRICLKGAILTCLYSTSAGFYRGDDDILAETLARIAPVDIQIARKVIALTMHEEEPDRYDVHISVPQLRSMITAKQCQQFFEDMAGLLKNSPYYQQEEVDNLLQIGQAMGITQVELEHLGESLKKSD